jgi:hypothetical protein
MGGTVKNVNGNSQGILGSRMEYSRVTNVGFWSQMSDGTLKFKWNISAKFLKKVVAQNMEFDEYFDEIFAQTGIYWLNSVQIPFFLWKWCAR